MELSATEVTPTGNISDSDKDGILADANIAISCSFGTSPGQNWITYQGNYIQKDQSDISKISGFYESTSNLTASYYDDNGVRSDFVISLKHDVARRTATKTYGMIYTENIVKNGITNASDLSGVYTPNDSANPYNGGIINAKGTLFSQTGVVVDDYINVNNLSVGEGCNGPTSGSVTTTAANLDYVSCNTYTNN